MPFVNCQHCLHRLYIRYYRHGVYRIVCPDCQKSFKFKLSPESFNKRDYSIRVIKKKITKTKIPADIVIDHWVNGMNLGQETVERYGIKTKDRGFYREVKLVRKLMYPAADSTCINEWAGERQYTHHNSKH